MKESDAPVCRVVEKNRERVEAAVASLPDDETVMKLADFLSAFSDYTRVKILLALRSGELCPCDISAITGMSISAVSHQLRILRYKKLVKYRREGRNIYYSLHDRHVEEILGVALEHVGEGE
jgi:DNA-binding transcriptional ArsR family regulator